MFNVKPFWPAVQPCVDCEDQTPPYIVGGDVSGTLDDITVIGLQGRTLASDAPANGNVLTWDAGQSRWEPAAPAGSSQNPFVPTITTPPLTGWSLVNPGGGPDSTLTIETSSVLLEFDPIPGTNARVVTRAQPATPYTIKAVFIKTIIDSAAYPLFGFRDSASGNLIAIRQNDSIGISVVIFTNPTTIATVSTGGAYTYPDGANFAWIMKIVNDGTNLRFFLSSPGNAEVLIAEDTIVNYAVTPDSVFFGASSSNTDGVGGAIELISWEVS